MLLTCLAMRTTTLRVGSAVMVLPWHNPVLLAEQAATLDLVSGGRLDFGIGKGYRHSEFKGFNIPPEEAEARFEEAVEIITRSCTRASASRIADGSGSSKTSWSSRRRRRRRIRRSGWRRRAMHSIRKAAARGFNLILDQYASPDAIGRPHCALSAERKAHGHGFDPMQVVVARQVYVAKDRADKEAALARQAEHTRRTVAVSRAPDAKGGSHVLAYAERPVPPKSMRCTGRRTRFAPSLKRCERPARSRCADAAGRRRAVAPLRARGHAGVRRRGEGGRESVPAGE